MKRSLPNSSARLQPYVVECQRRRCATNQASLRTTQRQEFKMKVEQMKSRETALQLGLIGAKDEWRPGGNKTDTAPSIPGKGRSQRGLDS